MDSGTKVFRAYISSSSPELNWIEEGVVSEIVADGVPLVRMPGGTMTPLDDKWHANRTGARRDVHIAIIRHIGRLQAKADEIADEILHADLMSQEVVNGVA